MKDTDRKKAAAALAECRTFTEAAERIGVDRRTLFRWLKEDEELHDLAVEAVELADMERHERDVEVEDRAREVLWSIVNDKETAAADRVKAIKELLGMIDKGVGARRLRQWGGRWRSLLDDFDDMFS